MEELITEIENVVANERKRANAIHGANLYDDHQGYAIILEELEEAFEEIESVKLVLQLFWEDVKNDELDYAKLMRLKNLWQKAYNCAAEVIQLCGTVEKVRDAILTRGGYDVSKFQ